MSCTGHIDSFVAHFRELFSDLYFSSLPHFLILFLPSPFFFLLSSLFLLSFSPVLSVSLFLCLPSLFSHFDFFSDLGF